MYHLVHFGGMIRDNARMDAFVEALKRTVQPGSVVVDIGTGTGIFALIACQLGARHVYAIEPNPFIEIGQQIAAANGFADRITFYKEMSTRVELPEKADLIIGDIRGQLPLFQSIIPTFADARARFLKPGGRIIPQRDLLYATLICAPDLYRKRVINPWIENPYQLDMRAALHTVTNSNSSDDVTADQIILPPQVWTELDYRTRSDLNAGRTLSWTVETVTIAHFVMLWFDSELTDGIGFSNKPGANGPTVYGTMQLPLSEPMALSPGEQVTLDLHADFIGSDYFIRWNTSVAAPDGTVRQKFAQSNLFSTPLSGLHRRAMTYVPELSDEGQATRFILNAMSEGKPLKEIAALVAAQFPALYPTADSAFTRAADLSQNYSR